MMIAQPVGSGLNLNHFPRFQSLHCVRTDICLRMAIKQQLEGDCATYKDHGTLLTTEHILHIVWRIVFLSAPVGNSTP